MKRHFSNENIQTTHIHMKKCSTLPAIREMQLKNAMKYQYLPIRTGKIKKCLYQMLRMQGNWNSHTELVWHKMVQALQKVVYQFLKKTHTLTTQPSNCTPQQVPRDVKTAPHKHLYTKAPGSFICNSPKPETTRMSLDRRMMKQTVVHPYRGRLVSSHSEWTTDTHNNLDASQGNYAE